MSAEALSAELMPTSREHQALAVWKKSKSRFRAAGEEKHFQCNRRQNMAFDTFTVAAVTYTMTGAVMASL